MTSYVIYETIISGSVRSATGDISPLAAATPIKAIQSINQSFQFILPT